jgi:hypothetical protein
VKPSTIPQFAQPAADHFLSGFSVSTRVSHRLVLHISRRLSIPAKIHVTQSLDKRITPLSAYKAKPYASTVTFTAVNPIIYTNDKAHFYSLVTLPVFIIYNDIISC